MRCGDFQVYARAGVCPTRTTFDHWQAAAHGPLLLPLLQDGVRWHIGVAGAAPLGEAGDGGLGTAVQHTGIEQLYTISYEVLCLSPSPLCSSSYDMVTAAPPELTWLTRASSYLRCGWMETGCSAWALAPRRRWRGLRGSARRRAS